MKITRVTGWSIKLPYVEGVYRMSGDRITSGMDAVVVRVAADDGTVGIGESGNRRRHVRRTEPARTGRRLDDARAGVARARPEQSAVRLSTDERGDDRAPLCQGSIGRCGLGSRRPGGWPAAVATTRWGCGRSRRRSTVPFRVTRPTMRWPAPCHRLEQGYRAVAGEGRRRPAPRCPARARRACAR